MTGYTHVTPTVYLIFSTRTRRPIGKVEKLPQRRWRIVGEDETHPTLYRAMKILEKRLH